MLNPKASDFTPSGLSTPPPEKQQQQPPSKEIPPFSIIKKKPHEVHHKKKNASESNKASNTTHQQQQQQKAKKQVAKQESAGSGNRKTESQINSSSKKPAAIQQHRRNRRKSSHTSSSSAAAATSSLEDQFAQETKFIAVEAAIPPMHRIVDRRRSLSDQFEHGYERYIDWIDRSLRKFDTVTMVGMDNAIKDVVSMVTILHDRKISAYDDIETFTMNQEDVPNNSSFGTAKGNDRFTSCIQVKLHPFF